MHRSYLYVPGDRPDRLAKALTTPADAIIADLEDGVGPDSKDLARAAVCALLEGLDTDAVDAGLPSIVVRVNPEPLLAEDLAAVVAAGVGSIYLPKATGDTLERCSELLASLEGSDASGEVRVVPLVESARGLLDAPAMAVHPRVRNLAIGEADLGAELALEPSPSGNEMLYARSSLVVASAAAHIDPPTGPVSTDFRDLESLRDDTVALRRLGFGARSAIHPAQLEVINEVFTPTAAEFERARELVALFEESLARGDGVCTGPDGRMVDEAVVRSARQILARSRAQEQPDG